MTLTRPMLVLGATYLLSCFLLVSMEHAHTQEIAKPKAKTSKDKTSASQPGTENAPLHVKGEITTSKRADEAKEDADERKEKRANDQSLVRYTGLTALFALLALVVAGFQAWFFWRQLRLMRESIDDAYEVFRNTHFPKLEVRRVRLPAPESTANVHGIEFVLANVGTVAASNITANINAIVVPRAELPNFQSQAFPMYGNENVDIGAMIVRQRPDGRSDLKPRERFAIFAERNNLLRAKRDSFTAPDGEVLFFFGYITFHDQDGIARDTGFFRAYDATRKEFLPAGDRDYEWS